MNRKTGIFVSILSNQMDDHELVICEDCGAVVYDEAEHLRFHDRIDRIKEDVRCIEEKA